MGSNTPRYAILSHTWGADHEEVTFKDLTEGTGKNKAGYRKLNFCGKQAAKDKLQFFWVDTCCIDKSSSAELSEAINSMFRLYHNAAKCYVYLSDVSISTSPGNESSFQQIWKPSFRQSRWFIRGWTLQELIAPACVEFFSVEGERLGDKGLMVQEIHEITGIDIQALQGRPLFQFSVDERMLWVGRRETKREEDAAYCLLGIFDVHMPLLYGEGRENAHVRLRKEIEYSTNIKKILQKTDSLMIKTESTLYSQTLFTYIAMPWLIVTGLFGAQIPLPFELTLQSFILIYIITFLVIVAISILSYRPVQIIMKLVRSMAEKLFE